MQPPDTDPTANQVDGHPTTAQRQATVRDSSADDFSHSRPLLVTADPHLRHLVLSLAHRCGADIDVASDPVTARDRFGSAPVVLVGVDVAEACVRARLPRRPGVIVVDAQHGAPHGDDADLPCAATAHIVERLGAEYVAMLPAGAQWLTDRLSTPTATTPDGPLATQSPQMPTPLPAKSRGTLVAVLGGRGGAGASVLACGLAVTAVRSGLRTLLIDGDPLGGGLDLVFDLEGSPGLRWSDLTHTPAAMTIPALVNTRPQLGDLTILSCGRDDDATVPVETMKAVLTAARAGWDLVVVDLPRRFDDATVAALAAVDHTLLVVPAELRACAAAARVAAEAVRHTESVSLLVRTSAPGRLSAREISRALGLPLAGTLRPEPAIARGLERGEPPAFTGQGPLATLCIRILAGLGHR